MYLAGMRDRLQIFGCLNEKCTGLSNSVNADVNA